MFGIETFDLLAWLLLLASPFWIVFVLPKLEKERAGAWIGLNWVFFLLVTAVFFWPPDWNKLTLWLLLFAAMSCLKMALWFATRDPYEWEANRRALKGGGSDADWRLGAPGGRYNKAQNRIEIFNRLSGVARYLAQQPGHGWRGFVARLVF